MSKVITFSRQFPAYHPKAGQPTYFVEKVWRSSLYNSRILPELNGGMEWGVLETFQASLYRYSHDLAPKHHTIRAGHRFKAGDYFSPRVWSGKPYRSKQIVIAPDIEIKKVWDFGLKDEGKKGSTFHIDGCYPIPPETFDLLAKNDGLCFGDLLNWIKYPKPFDGQIICWNENINY